METCCKRGSFKDQIANTPEQTCAVCKAAFSSLCCFRETAFFMKVWLNAIMDKRCQARNDLKRNTTFAILPYDPSRIRLRIHLVKPGCMRNSILISLLLQCNCRTGNVHGMRFLIMRFRVQVISYKGKLGFIPPNYMHC